MSPPSDDDEVSWYLSSNSLSDDNGVTHLQAQCPEGEEEDSDADDTTDGSRRGVTHMEHYNQHDRQRCDRQQRWWWWWCHNWAGVGGGIMEDKDVDCSEDLTRPWAKDKRFLLALMAIGGKGQSTWESNWILVSSQVMGFLYQMRIHTHRIDSA